MKAITATLWLTTLVSGLLASSLHEKNLPFELQVIRGAATRECQVISFRKTQIIRGLGPDESHVASLRTVSGDEKLSIISYREDALWTRAASLCEDSERVNRVVGRPSTVMVNRVEGQKILSDNVLSPAYPPLEIFPLINSGSSANRVDLVFFSDGCK